MLRLGRRGSLLAIAGLLLCLAGCGGSSKSSTSAQTSSTVSTQSTTASVVTSSTSSGTASPHYVRTTVHTGTTGADGSVALASLGTLTYSCAHTGEVSAKLGGRVEATENVYVEGDGRRHLRSGTVQPPPALTLAGARTRVLAWHINQSTEPQTLDGIVTVSFQPGGAGGCSSAKWRSFVGVISHAGHWTAPRGWL